MVIVLLVIFNTFFNCCAMQVQLHGMPTEVAVSRMIDHIREDTRIVRNEQRMSYFSVYPWGPAVTRYFLRQDPSCCASAIPFPLEPAPQCCSCVHCCYNIVALGHNNGCRLTSCFQTSGIVMGGCGTGMFFVDAIEVLFCQNAPLTAALPVLGSMFVLCGLCAGAVSMRIGPDYAMPCTHDLDRDIWESIIGFNNWYARQQRNIMPAQ